MKYLTLGPLRVVDTEGSSFISARKVDILFAALLIRADRLVTTDQLMTELWGDKPPRRATAGLHVYISELRKFLNRGDSSDNRIVTRPPGYLLALGDDELDAQQFLNLVNLGRDHVRQGRHEEAVDCLEYALSLWHGPAFGDLVGGPMIESFSARLYEVKMECTEMLVDSQLLLGRHREVIGRLYSLITEFPLRETFYRQLMLALYRSDRRGDALKVYQSAHRALNTELGLEPCRTLRELQRAILAGDDRVLLESALLTAI